VEAQHPTELSAIFAQEFVASNDANRGTNRATPNESMAETFDTDAKD
jgi:hypothetical protein